jgi:hypothetical protein
MGAFESLLMELGSMVEERGGFKLYECFVDGTFSKAKGGGDGIGCTKAGKLLTCRRHRARGNSRACMM